MGRPSLGWHGGVDGPGRYGQRQAQGGDSQYNEERCRAPNFQSSHLLCDHSSILFNCPSALVATRRKFMRWAPSPCRSRERVIRANVPTAARQGEGKAHFLLSRKSRLRYLVLSPQRASANAVSQLRPPLPALLVHRFHGLRAGKPGAGRQSGRWHRTCCTKQLRLIANAPCGWRRGNEDYVSDERKVSTEPTGSSSEGKQLSSARL